MEKLKKIAKRSFKRDDKKNELPKCIKVVTTCDPRGFDCETCMHLGPTTSPGPGPPVDDLCFITPKSLQRPLRYTKHYLRGTPKNMQYPTSQVTGVLKEIKQDKSGTYDVGCLTQQTKGADINNELIKSHNVYIEHNGRFTKAPRHLISSGDFALRECFLEDTEGPASGGTPLDIAIVTQRLWTPLAKILQGILAGVALLESLLVRSLFIRADEDELGEVFQVYSYLDGTITCIFQIFLIAILIALFDWIDLHHLNVRHLWDTFAWRKIWILIGIYLTSFIFLNVCATMNDAFSLHATENSTFTIGAQLLNDPEWFAYLYQWRHMCLAKDTLVIFGWVLTVILANDDLFLEHLLSMKKYDFETTSPKMEDIELELLP